MKATVKVEFINGEIEIIASKSLLHRYLIMASRSPHTKIFTYGISRDVHTTISILKRLGSDIFVGDFPTTINIEDYRFKQTKRIDFGESGASLRFLLTYSFIEERDIDFSAKGRLPERPIAELVDELSRNGVSFTNNRLPFSAHGKITGSHFSFRGDISSQFISGIMLSAPFLEREIKIELTSLVKSKSYIEMTRKLMQEMGVSPVISKNYDEIVIPKSKYSVPKEIHIEGDWSNAIVAISLAILKGELIVKGLNRNSYQGDAKSVEILQSLGAKIRWEEDFLKVEKSELQAFDLDVEDNIDLFPVLSILALSCKGESVFRNIGRLRLKESDRVESVLQLHKSLGSEAYVQDENFYVKACNIKSAKVQSFNDHRIVMAAVVAAALDDVEIEIEGFEAIEKSYSNFIWSMKSIGVNIGV